jgi:hypothetical protein
VVAPAVVRVVEAPPLRAKAAGGYGSAVLARPRTRQVVFTRHLGAPRIRWLTFDLETAEFQEGTGFPGDLRDGAFDDDGAWLLGTHGLARVAFDPPRVLEIVRERLGAYQHRLLRLTPTLLGVSAYDGKTLALVDTARREVVKRLRMPAPDLALEGQMPVLCAFGARVARTLNPVTLRLGEATALPQATSPLAVGERIVVLTGELAPFGRVVSAFSEEPAGYRIAPERFVAVAREDLRPIAEGGDARGLIALIGVDAEGRLVATAEWGISVVDPQTFAELRRVEVRYPPVSACWVPEAGTAVFLLHYLVEPPPGGFDPVPEKLVLLRW